MHVHVHAANARASCAPLRAFPSPARRATWARLGGILPQKQERRPELRAEKGPSARRSACLRNEWARDFDHGFAKPLRNLVARQRLRADNALSSLRVFAMSRQYRLLILLLLIASASAHAEFLDCVFDGG